MQALGCIAEIEKLIPFDSRNTIVAALRQDSCVWDAINAPGFIEQLKARFSIAEPNWSPSNLSLIALGIPLDARRLSTDMVAPLDGQLSERAKQTYQATLQAPAPSGDLGDAGLVALAMREIKRKTPDWKDILDALRQTSTVKVRFDQDIWRTSLACVFGMIPDPIDFLAALLAGVPGDHAYNIISHVILSNPLSLSQQSKIFLTLFERVGMSQQLILLRHLNCIGRDELVNMIATQLIAEKKAAPVQAAGDGHQPREIEFE
ncbi:MAG: hypothetical protein U1B80_03085, partial [Anaerolineaceae bacterium]|nr:hypothetical protein [Anaerolineaceae bacterium]